MKIKYSITAAIGLALFSQLAIADTVIGRWCDRVLPGTPEFNHIMEIVINDSGKSVLKSKFGDGSSSVTKLNEASGSMYIVADSDFGDRYRIVSSSGDLQLLDEDGLIRVAKRLENKPTPGECTN